MTFAQDVLTFAINATIYLGFGGIVAHSVVTSMIAGINDVKSLYAPSEYI